MEKKILDVIEDILSFQKEFIFNMDKFLMFNLIDNISPCTTNMISVCVMERDIDNIKFLISFMLNKLHQVCTFQEYDFTNKEKKEVCELLNENFSVIQQCVNEFNFLLGILVDVDKCVDIKSFKKEMACNIDFLERQINKIKTIIKIKEY